MTRTHCDDSRQCKQPVQITFTLGRVQLKSVQCASVQSSSGRNDHILISVQNISMYYYTCGIQTRNMFPYRVNGVIQMFLCFFPLLFRYVCIAMEALDQLLMACHCQSINLFVESFLKMVRKLLESDKPSLQILGTNSVSFQDRISSLKRPSDVL